MSESVPERQYAVNHSAEVLRTPAAEALSLLSYQVLRLAAVLTETGDTLARPAAQTSARWQVLAAIEHEPLSVADIARRLGQARQSVQRIADLLSSAGVTTYQVNPAHRRAKLLSLTSSGRATLRDIQRRQAAWANQISQGLDEKQLLAASAALQQLQEVLDEIQDR